jgi:hypothetical protein
VRSTLCHFASGQARREWSVFAVAIGLVLCVSSIAQPKTLRADDSPTYAIACRVEFDRDPALTVQLQDEVVASVRKMFDAVLGPEHQLRFLGEPIGTYAGGSLADLDSDAVIRDWSSAERLLLVRAGRESNQFAVESREYDPQFQIVGPVAGSRVMQRELVAGAAARAALRAFAPAAEVRAATGTNVQIEFRAGRRLQAYRSWLGMDGSVGLQVMSVPAGRGGPTEEERPARYRRSFLVLRNWDGDRAECELIGPDSRTMFQRLGAGRVRYLARPTRGGPSTVRVEVVRKDGRQPHEGCEVFVSPQQFTTDPSTSRGITDSAGQVRFATTGSGLQFVSVRYEDLVMKLPLLPGASHDPLVFELQTRGRRADYVRPLRQLLDEIDDQFRVDLRLREDLKAKAEAKDTAEVRKLIARGRQQRITVQQVDERTRDVEFRASRDGEDVSALATFVREAAERKISKQVDQTLAEFSDWAERLDRQLVVDDLTGRINDLQAKMDWAALVPLYQRLVEMAPGNKEYADQLRRLENNLRVKSPEHEKARDFAENEMKSITSQDLAARWQEIDRSVHGLLTAKDHLTLLKVRKLMSTWARDLGQDVKGLVDQIQAAGKDDDRVQELREKLERIDAQNKSLIKLHRDVQQFLEKLEL